MSDIPYNSPSTDIPWAPDVTHGSVPFAASNNPGPLTAPMAQGMNHPGTKQAPNPPFESLGPFNSPKRTNVNNG